MNELLIFVVIPINYIFVKFILYSHNIVLLYIFFFIFNHLFYSLLKEKYKINSFILSVFTTLSYLFFSFSSILINLSNTKLSLIIQHFIICVPSYLFYKILN